MKHNLRIHQLANVLKYFGSRKGFGGFCDYCFTADHIDIFDTFLDLAWKNIICLDDIVQNCA